MKHTWQPIPRDQRLQYGASKTALYAEMQNVPLAGDDMCLMTTVDIIAERDTLFVSFYRYNDENPFEDFQLSFTMPVASKAEAQQKAEEYIRYDYSLSLRYLKSVGFSV